MSATRRRDRDEFAGEFAGELAGDEPADRVELLADDDRPGGWLLLIDRIRQSYVDLEDPTYLDFEYVQAFADALEAMPDGPLAVTHVGGGAGTLARYVAATRPGSSQLVLEPDEAVTALVRARLPYPRGARVRIRPVDGRSGVAALRDGSADVVVLDAFHGGRVPADLTTVEFLAEVVRVLRPDGMFLANVADGPPITYSRRLVRTARDVFADVALVAEPAVLRGRRHGNVVLVASRDRLSLEQLVRASARAAFPRTVTAGDDLVAFSAGVAPLTDADGMRSPQPPEELWRVQ